MRVVDVVRGVRFPALASGRRGRQPPLQRANPLATGAALVRAVLDALRAQQRIGLRPCAAPVGGDEAAAMGFRDTFFQAGVVRGRQTVGRGDVLGIETGDRQPPP